MQNDMRDRLMELLKKADKNAEMKFITDYEDAILDNAEYLIANDVVPVVRCKDCKHCRKDAFFDYCDKYSRPFDKLYVEKDHFCSYGERKEDNGKIY